MAKNKAEIVKFLIFFNFCKIRAHANSLTKKRKINYLNSRIINVDIYVWDRICF